MDTHSTWASDELTTPDAAGWDLLVIGGGTAGLVAAKTAAGFGARVLMVERERTGGDCLWTGCVPSKALLHVAHTAAAARRAASFGIHTGAVRVDFAQVMAHVRAAIAAIEPVDSPATLRDAGVRVTHGTARLLSATTADVGGVTVAFRQALLATGSAPVVPPIDGLAQSSPLTSDTIWTLEALPERLLIIGGGSIGCELGQAFARLGARVSIVQSHPRLLMREDPDAATILTDALAADGVSIHTGTTVTRIRPAPAGWGAELADGTEIGFDRVLVAAGRRPRTTDLGLDMAGVGLDERGYVRVDALLRTSNRRIFAAGDVTGHPQFTHTAGVHGSVAAGNAILGLRRRADVSTTPRVTYTQPEVAAFGISAAQAPSRGLTVRTVPHADVDRAVTDGDTAGFTRLILDGRTRVVGASIVGPRAGESLAEVVLAARQGLRASAVAGATHAYPTYADGVWKAAIEQVQHQLRAPAAQRVIAALAGLRRRWTSR
ncbi:FAD-dependent oxidoreductase [Actinoplanes sp. NPDC023801]|uniref:dihydrolipoyl dehydrogenase family protein n=1 Tax=Actinoplanes sp. NPDC023801 TaxID=3154595 RepID=UPI00340FCD46